MIGNKYEIEKTISEFNTTIIFKGIRTSDNFPVVIKALKEEYPSQETILKFKYEYEVLKTLNVDGVVKLYDNINFKNAPAIVEEYFDGKSLLNFIDITLKEKIEIFIKVAEILGNIHRYGIIHKDINPNNILVKAENMEIRIIDFGLSIKLDKEEQELKNPNILEGTLDYLSPEQTGRMNRHLDYRTDYYSLGATFYKLLTGEDMFPEAKDAMEIVHFHIAKQPIPPHDLNSKIPKAVSNILLKLLEKTAEKRYQSNYGLIYDLKKALEYLEEGSENFNFELGQEDKNIEFRIPQKLYGREIEKDELIQCVENILIGEPEIILVSGYSGIGKSALINEVHKSISKNKGYFVSGKFDQYQKDVPYSALITALRELLKLVLGEDESKIEKIKTSLSMALGENGKLLVDVIPELELLLGKQDYIQLLSPIEAENRFKFVFENFIRIFATKDHPLIIFLDDLQWVDTATLNILKILIKDLKLQYFLFIGAYRDNEIFLSHPLSIAIESFSKDIKINQFNLKTLSKEHVNILVAETLNGQDEETNELSNLIYKKTAGNPFFTKEFLTTLSKEKFINFDYEKMKWGWDIEKIKDQNITGNVVEFMLKNLKKLPISTQEMLSLGACIGNKFNLSTLAYISKNRIEEIAVNLWPAVKDGFIIPLGAGHKLLAKLSLDECLCPENLKQMKIMDKFLHDRVQQAAYELIPLTQRESIHLKIGRMLLKNYKKDNLEESIFFLLEHLNKGRQLIVDKNEKIELAELNYLAAKKENESNAYSIAAQHSSIGIKLLGENLWKDNYELSYKLFIENAEAEYLSRNFENAEISFNILLENSKDKMDRYNVYKIMILYFISINKFCESIDIGVKALSEWGVELPNQNSITEIDEQYNIELIKYKESLKIHKISELSELNSVSSKDKEICIEILEKMIDGSYLGNPDILKLIILKQVNLSIEYGNSESTPSGYVWWGVMLVGENNINDGYDFGKSAIELVKKSKNYHIMCRTYHMFGGFIQFRKEHISSAVESLIKAFELGNNSGDINYSNYAEAISGRYVFYQGKRLQTVKKHAEICINFMEKTKHQGMFEFYNSMRYTILSLLGETEDKFILNSDKDTEEKKLAEWHEKNLNLQIALYYILKVYIHYIYEDYRNAETYIKKAKEYLMWINPQFDVIQFWFYSALVKTALYKTKNIEEKQKDIEHIDLAIEQIEFSAKFTEENCMNKLHILKAERNRILHNVSGAVIDYEKGIEFSKQNRYIQEEALANELYAKFWFENKSEKLGKIFLNEALYRYKKWGADRKHDLMKKEYSVYLEDMFFLNSLVNTPDNRGGTLSSTTKQEVLDFGTIVKASQVLSKEIKIVSLLKRMMYLVIENAGAERGVFVTRESGQDYVLIETDTLRNNINSEKTNLFEYNNLLKSVVYYVLNSEEKVVIDDAETDKKYFTCEYVKKKRIRSVLCYPVVNKGKLVGVIYLENNMIPSVFTENRIEVLNILSAQLAISLENAILYENLENKVKERTLELFKKNELLKIQNLELERLSTTDQLTEVYNRRYLEEKLQVEINRCITNNVKISLIILDIDHFKNINDTYGHNVGDEVLLKVAKTINLKLSQRGILGRWGGEEFLMILKECDTPREIAEEIRKTLENTTYENAETVTASMGIAIYIESDTKDSIVNRADKGLYLAKKRGRNRIESI